MTPKEESEWLAEYARFWRAVLISCLRWRPEKADKFCHDCLASDTPSQFLVEQPGWWILSKIIKELATVDLPAESRGKLQSELYDILYIEDLEIMDDFIKNIDVTCARLRAAVDGACRENIVPT
jgi:hypothetical protein